MKIFFFLLICLPAFAQETKPLYQISYIEKREGVTRELSARIKGVEVSLDKVQGSFPKNIKISPPWYLQGLAFLQERAPLELEGFPPLILQRKFSLEKEEDIFGAPLAKYRLDLVLEAKEEVIPLNEEEAKTNEILRPFGVQEVRLKGKGELMFDKSKELIVAEQFILAGDVIQNNVQKSIKIEWAKAIQK